MRRLILLGLLFFSGVCFALNPTTEVQFKQYVYDFGEINELDGDVEHTFEYTNVGKKSFVIYNISTSCGCTIPTYSKKPLSVGGSGELKIVFDPTNQVGRIEKRIIVSCNVEGGAVELKIKALVKPRPRTVEDDYPVVFSDGVRLADIVVEGYTLSNKKETTITMDLINNSTKATKITVVTDSLPSWMTALVAQPFLNGKQKSKLVVTVRPKGDLWGQKRVFIPILVNDKTQFVDVIFNAIFVEDFSNLSETELKDAPKVALSNSFYHFSTLERDEKVEFKFKIKNNGINPLIIRNIDHAKNVVIGINGSEIKGGQEAEITLSVDTSQPEAIAETVRFITTDPMKPVAEFRVMANIK